MPFTGSDGQTHLVYELWLANFSSAGASIERAQISNDRAILQALDSGAVEKQLQPAGMRKSSASMPASTQSLLFIDLKIPGEMQAPKQLNHQMIADFVVGGAHRQATAKLDGTVVNNRPVMVIGPPLVGQNYVSADSCCDAIRHTRAALAVDGALWVAQRYAVDWEEFDSKNRIYSGPRKSLTSYTIYGKPVLAVANGTVVTAINDQPDQVPGAFPEHITLDQADGNAVILDLGNGVFLLYAHMQPGSVRVKVGDRVTRGETIGLVGNSGNTIAPHLHFQAMDRPFSLASNGFPYEIDSFQITGITLSTEAFDTGEANGTPLQITPVAPPKRIRNSLPLDQLIISLGAARIAHRPLEASMG